MQRYYLDTNIIVFILGSNDNLSPKIREYLFAEYPVLYISSITVSELLFLFKIGKKIKWAKEIQTENDILDKIDELDLIIRPFNHYHLKTFADLKIKYGHKDINDLQIISQAISDKIPLISSDQEFSFYTNQGLDFIFNER